MKSKKPIGVILVAGYSILIGGWGIVFDARLIRKLMYDWTHGVGGLGNWVGGIFLLLVIPISLVIGGVAFTYIKRWARYLITVSLVIHLLLHIGIGKTIVFDGTIPLHYRIQEILMVYGDIVTLWLIYSRKIRGLFPNQKSIVADMPSGMKFIEVTWMRIFKIWWSLAWKSGFFGVLGGVLAGGIAGLILAITGGKFISAGVAGVAGGVAGGLSGIPVGMLIMKSVLNKRFSDFRIALIQK